MRSAQATYEILDVVQIDKKLAFTLSKFCIFAFATRKLLLTQMEHWEVKQFYKHGRKNCRPGGCVVVYSFCPRLTTIAPNL